MTNHTILFCSVIILCIIFVKNVSSVPARPVVLLHGVIAGSETMELISEQIQQMHPGTRIYNIPRYSGWSSLQPMWHQVDKIGRDIMTICAKHPEGINLIGYSQGGLIARAILQKFPEHNVQSFISLSSPQAGQYGTEFLHLIFPHLVRSTAYELFYSILGQHTSIGNYWNDPYHQELYLKYSKFLPYINNELLSPFSKQFKNGITKLRQMILIGGPDDGVITPWQSSHFGYYEKGTVVEMRDRDIYKTDAIGLKTLDNAGKLFIHSIPKINHKMWHINQTVFNNYILPYLH